MRTARWAAAGSLIAVLQVLGPGHVDAQAVYERSLQAVRSIGTVNGFEIDYVAPRVRKVRGPQNLPETWIGPWYGQGDDYSRQSYQRYVNASLEGPQVYDAFGVRRQRLERAVVVRRNQDDVAANLGHGGLLVVSGMA